jgi:hypothetical protein
MAKEQQTGEQQLSGLVQGAVSDIETLLRQHFDLLRSEMKEELYKGRDAALSIGAGVGAAAVGSILGTLMLVHLLRDVTRLPLWACYGAVGGVFGLLGGGLLKTGVQQASDLDFIPRQTAEVVKEELTGQPAHA